MGLKDQLSALVFRGKLALIKQYDIPAIERMLDAVDDRNETISRLAIEALEDNQAALAYLQSSLQDPNPTTRFKAAYHLGVLSPKGAVDWLITALTDQAPQVRDAAAGALGNIGDQKAVEPLIEALTTQKIQDKAAEALGKLGDSRAVNALVSALGYYSNVFSRFDKVVAAALVSLGANHVVEPLVAYCLKDDVGLNRGSVMEVFHKLNSPRAVDLFIAALEDPDADIRANAAGWLGLLGSSRAIKPLSLVMYSDETQVSQTACAALEKIDDPVARAEAALWRARSSPAKADVGLEDEFNSLLQEKTFELMGLGHDISQIPMLATNAAADVMMKKHGIPKKEMIGIIERAARKANT